MSIFFLAKCCQMYNIKNLSVYPDECLRQSNGERRIGFGSVPSHLFFRGKGGSEYEETGFGVGTIFLSKVYSSGSENATLTVRILVPNGKIYVVIDAGSIGASVL